MVNGQTRLGRPSQPQIGFVLSHEQWPPPALLEQGVAAEQAGFDAVWTSDHFQPWMDNQGNAGFAWITLAALGGRMPRIPMGTGVTCPSYRYRPAVVAQAFATLDILYPGRVFLGVGAGEALNEQPASGEWGAYKERAARLVEAVEVIRALWSGELVNYRGRHYTVQNAKLYSPPSEAIPIYMAASGEHSARNAGQYGDGLITDPKSLKKPEFRAAFEAGARAAGRDAAAMPILVETWAVVGDEAAARQGAALWRFVPKSWEKYVDIPDPREIQREAEAEVPLEEVYKDWAVGTDAATHVEALQELVDLGASHIFVHSPQADQGRMIDFYGGEVLPRFRKR